VISLANKGNTAVIVKPKIVIDGLFGLYHEELTDDDIYLYREDKTTFRMNWENIPVGGLFTAHATMEYYENNIVDDKVTYIDSVKSDVSISIIPWLWLGIVAVLIVVVVGTVIYKKEIYKKLLKNSEKYQVQPGDTLTGLAKKFNVNWKLLAKLNKLEEPYSLENIKELLIPKKK